jgi:hypothetical protein
MSDRIASAVFDSSEEAERALSDLRSEGINEDAISIIGRHGEQDSSQAIEDGSTSGSAGDNDDDGPNASGGVKGALGGAVVGGILGVAALAIPGVGPLAAAGAIASGAIPGAAAIGAGVGAGLGGLTGLMTGHGVSEEDAAYYEGRIKQGGTFLSVDAEKANRPIEEIRELLYRNGGHNSSRQRMEAGVSEGASSF